MRNTSIKLRHTDIKQQDVNVFILRMLIMNILSWVLVVSLGLSACFIYLGRLILCYFAPSDVNIDYQYFA